MKITKSRLVKIIKEEIKKVVTEQYSAGINDPAMLPDDVKIKGGKTMKELIASWVNKLEADALNSLNISNDQDAQKYIDAFGDPDLVDQVLQFMKDTAMGNKADASKAVAQVAKGVRRDYGVEEGKK
tara:strand:+ start:239 stop:619 length:381 start_codon:yes stop_codon:yes gene_type:complete